MGADNSKFASVKPEIVKLWIPPMNTPFEIPARRPSELNRKINQLLRENDPSNTPPTPTSISSRSSATYEKLPAQIYYEPFPKPDQWVLLDIDSRGIIHRSDVAERVVVSGKYIVLHATTLQKPGFDCDVLIQNSKSIFRSRHVNDVYPPGAATPGTSCAGSDFEDSRTIVEEPMSPRQDDEVLIRVYKDAKSSQPLKVITVPVTWTVHILYHHLEIESNKVIITRHVNTYKCLTYTSTQTLKSLGWGADGAATDIYTE
ncbi:hypothetical protein RUND412_007510 [Rhizina undulata]